MNILMTGATGLIGKEVGRRLVEAGHSLSVVSRNPDRARKELPFPAKAFAWDGGAFPKSALADIHAIIHLAGEPVAEGRWTPEKKKAIRDSRVVGTSELVKAIVGGAAPHLKVFVHGSAIGLYGDRGDELLTEVSSAGDDFLASVVREWEAAAEPLTTRGIRLAHIRTGVVLSRRGGALDQMIPIFARGIGGKLGNGQQWMSWIHIDDIVRAFLFALENQNAVGAFNGCAPEPARNDRFSVQLARALGRSLFFPIPEVALKAKLGEAAVVALASQRAMPTHLMELGFKFNYPELVPALDEICEPLRGGQHEMFAEQWIPQTPAEIFPYFCDEKNLEELTPKFMGFKVVGKSTPEIREGTLIDYRLSVHGIPMKWRTEIASWKPGKSFVDTQLKGPYKKWHHTHEFLPLAGGTLLRDRVLFRLPMGLLGDAVAGWKVIGDVQTIFDYRRKIIDEKFGVKA